MQNKKSIIILCLFWFLVILPYQLFSGAILYVFGSLTIIWLYYVYRLYQKKKRWKPLFFLSPICVLFVFGMVSGIYSYINGSGTFLFHNEKNIIDLRSYEDFDPEYRVYYHNFRGQHYGALNFITPATLFKGKINDVTLKILTNCFGYQFGMYSGKLPTTEEIFNAFLDEKAAVTFTYIDHEKARLTYKDERYSVKKSTRMVRKPMEAIDCYNGNCYVSDAFYPLLIVSDQLPTSETHCMQIQLIDLENNIIFAEYSMKKYQRFGNTFCGDQ